MFNTCLSWFLFDVVGICDIIFLSKVCTHLCKWRSIYKLSRQADTCMSMDAIHTIISALWILGFKRPVFTFIMLSSYGDEYMAINKDHWFPCIKNQNVHCVCLRVFQIDIMTIFFFLKTRTSEWLTWLFTHSNLMIVCAWTQVILCRVFKLFCLVLNDKGLTMLQLKILKKIDVHDIM